MSGWFLVAATTLARAFGGKELVLVGDVDDERLGDLREVAEEAIEADAVVGDVDVRVRLLGHHEGGGAAEAVAERPDFAVGDGPVGAGERPRDGDGRLQVLDALGPVERLEELEGALPLGLGLVGDVDAGLDPPRRGRGRRR